MLSFRLDLFHYFHFAQQLGPQAPFVDTVVTLRRNTVDLEYVDVDPVSSSGGTIGFV